MFKYCNVVRFAFYKYRGVLAAIITKMNMLVLINLQTNTITVFLDRRPRVMSNFDRVNSNLQFTLSNEQIPEITNTYGMVIFDN